MKIDEIATFHLMRREKNQFNVVKASTRLSKFKIPHISDAEELILHSKLLLANSREISQIIECERTALNNQLVADGEDCPESIYIEIALQVLKTRQDNLQEYISSNINHRVSESSEISEISDVSEDIKIPTTLSLDKFKEFDEEFVIDEESKLTLQDVDIAVASSDSSKYYYFYQADDGQHLYLHNVNIRMLQAMYGSIENSPPTISGKIIQKQSCSMTEDLRRRLKFLQHLPVTCQFEVAEVKLDTSLISSEVFERFRGKILPFIYI